jgi:nicotinate-nucleotide adenylyltransferase
MFRNLSAKAEGDDSLWIAHFGGSYNPVHLGHVAIGRRLIQQYGFDRVVYVPVGDGYAKDDLAPESDRFRLLQIAIADEPRFEACDHELGRAGWSATQPFETIMHLRSRHQQGASRVRVFSVRGGDWVREMVKWRDELAEHEGLYEFVVVPRVGAELTSHLPNGPEMELVFRMANIMECPETFTVSSSAVREVLGIGGDRAVPVHPDVLKEIRRRGLYDTHAPSGEVRHRERL